MLVPTLWNLVWVIMEINKHIIIWLFLLLLFGCESAPLTNGKKVRQTIAVAHFSKVAIFDVFNVYLIRDSRSEIILEGGANLLSSVLISCVNDSLSVKSCLRAKWLRKYERIHVYLKTDTFKVIEMHMPCYVQSVNTLRGKQILLWSVSKLQEADITVDCDLLALKSSHTAVGEITLRGKCRFADIWVYNACKVQASKLDCRYAKIRNEGIADVHIAVDTALQAYLLHNGNIYYSGNPNIEIVENSGQGKLYHEEK